MLWTILDELFKALTGDWLAIKFEKYLRSFLDPDSAHYIALFTATIAWISLESVLAFFISLRAYRWLRSIPIIAMARWRRFRGQRKKLTLVVCDFSGSEVARAKTLVIQALKQASRIGVLNREGLEDFGISLLNFPRRIPISEFDAAGQIDKITKRAERIARRWIEFTGGDVLVFGQHEASRDGNISSLMLTYVPRGAPIAAQLPLEIVGKNFSEDAIDEIREGAIQALLEAVAHQFAEVATPEPPVGVPPKLLELAEKAESFLSAPPASIEPRELNGFRDLFAGVAMSASYETVSDEWLEKAIDNYGSLARAQEGAPLLQAATLANLANVFGELGHRRGWITYIDSAIEIFRQVIDLLEKYELEASGQYAKTVVDLASAYCYMAELEENAVRLASAINFCTDKLNSAFAILKPAQRATVHCAMGQLFGASGKIDGDARKFRESLEEYEKAAEVLKRETYPRNWALIQSNIGHIHKYLGDLAVGDPVLEYRKADAAYRRACKILRRRTSPVSWAKAHGGRAYTWAKIGKIEKSERNLRWSIGAYRKVRKILLRKDVPFHWGAVSNNLAVTLTILAELSREKREYLQEAVAILRESTGDWLCAARPISWSNSKRNLAGALHSLADIDEDMTILADAAFEYVNCLEVGPRSEPTEVRGNTLIRLGNVLLRLGVYEREEYRFELAAKFFREAEEIFDGLENTEGREIAAHNLVLAKDALDAQPK